MGLIKAIKSAVSSVAADQWREYFYCEALDNDTLMTKGRKRINKGSNTKGGDNIITDGSVVAVNEGQCMIIVEQGKVVDFCAEAGEFIYDASTEPSLFYGDFDENIEHTFFNIGKRFSFGGDAAKDQRVYFFNTKEIMGNKYGTASPVPFRVVDEKIGLDIDITLRCNGEYSFRIVNPLLFYTNVCGNVTDDFTRDEIDSQLKTELLTALQPAFARISEMGIRYSSIPKHTAELAQILNEELSAKWSGLRGIAIVSFGVNSIKAPEEDEEMIKELQRTAVYRDPGMAAASLAGAQADAMRAAAANTATGPMMAFAGMNMANMAGGMNTNMLFEMGQKQAATQQSMAAGQQNMSVAQQSMAAGQQNMSVAQQSMAAGQQNMSAQQNMAAGQQSTAAGQQAQAGAGHKTEWACKCGATGNTGKFCGECGAAKPSEGWVCGCGTINKGKFCSECGRKRPD